MNEKKNKGGRPLKNIDVLDAMEYSFSNYMQSLNNSFNSPQKLDNMLVLL